MTKPTENEDQDPVPQGHKLASRATFRFASAKLSLAQNPVAQNDDGEHLLRHNRSEHDNLPSEAKSSNKPSPLQFHKREAASTSELFYDLWFVANLNVFATVHPIVDTINLVSFISYFLLLWITWLVTTVYDARFGQDGVLNRLGRACHLGVMMGFAVTGVSFGQAGIVAPIYKSMSFCLMASRLALCLQYATALYHARHHSRSRMTLAIAIIIHLVPAGGYLLCALIKAKNTNTHLIAIWYVTGLSEMAAVVAQSTMSETLSFEGTHFNERLNLLTLIILGEGVIILSKNLTKIVEYTWIKNITETWSAALCAMIACAASIIYITFQLYFDWMHHHNHMKNIHQMLWTIIHLPFHIVLVLLAEGTSQWVIWWRAIESFHSAEEKLIASVEDTIGNGNTTEIVASLNSTAQDILYKYGSDIAKKGGDSARDLEKTLQDLLTIPDSFWGSDWSKSNDTYQKFHNKFITVSSLVVDAIGDAYDLSYEKDDESKSAKSDDIDAASVEAVFKTTNRLVLVFIYVFLSASLVIILLMLMHLISKRRGWTSFNIFRTATVFMIGLGLGLVALIGTNPDLTAKFLLTPWQLPTITIAYFVVLVITHLPHPPRVFLKNSEADEMEMGTMSEYQTNEASQDAFRRKSTVRQSFHSLHHAARNIRLQAGAYDPVSEGNRSMDRQRTISSHNLYRV